MKERKHYKWPILIVFHSMSMLWSIGIWIAVIKVFSSTFSEIFIILAYVIVSTICLGGGALLLDHMDSKFFK